MHLAVPLVHSPGDGKHCARWKYPLCILIHGQILDVTRLQLTRCGVVDGKDDNHFSVIVGEGQGGMGREGEGVLS